MSPKETKTPKEPEAPKVVYEAPGTNDQGKGLTKAFVLLSLLGILSNVSELALSPVYGSIPASILHSRILMVGCFLGWAGNVRLSQVLPTKTANVLPLVAFYVPTVQFFLYGFSERLGVRWGPLVTEGFTLFPLAVLTASCVADYLEGFQVRGLPEFIAEAAPGMGSWATFKIAESLSRRYLWENVGRGFLNTRIGLETLLAASYTIFAPSKLIAFAIPAILHTSMLNTHVMTPQGTSLLNNTMRSENWMLLDRQESVTGYISVIENLEKGFRVMRCDHSLLGGEWILLEGQKAKESVFGVFAMLEAVRLVESKDKVADKDASALVIGLGIGTTPSALVAHGVDTTVVEIDPFVHQFATKYFDLKENNEPVLKDAVSYTANLVKNGSYAYDYIIHDVFTGGAEPVDLFTIEFLRGLSALLKQNGAIAINYAGDFTLPAPKLIANTILQVFPTCRFFRESPPPEFIAEGETDFTNMVIFCHKASDPLTFRLADMDDFLKSRTRQTYLQPKHEVKVLNFMGEDGGDVLTKNNTAVMKEWHQASAVGHWEIMRKVMPSKIWELW